MKILAWNVNSVTVRLERLLKLLDREQPDIVCLQELKCLDEKFPAEAVKQAGYHAVVHGQKTYNGVALLSKLEPKDVARGFSDGGDDTASRFVGATIGGIRTYSAYIPNGQEVGSEKYAYKLEWLRRLRVFLDAKHKATDPVVVAGDFNIAPEDRDVHDPGAWREKILCSTPERKALATICAFGLEDTFRLHHQDAGKYSWWDYRMLGFQKNQGLRIDFVLASKALAPKCTAASILRDERKGVQPSDHAPVVAELAL